jgi:hypothetical protein
MSAGCQLAETWSLAEFSMSPSQSQFRLDSSWQVSCQAFVIQVRDSLTASAGEARSTRDPAIVEMHSPLFLFFFSSSVTVRNKIELILARTGLECFAAELYEKKNPTLARTSQPQFPRQSYTIQFPSGKRAVH